MVDVAERRRIAHEVYTITGVLVPEDDPIVLAALFYAQKLRDAAGDAAGQLASASAESRAVVHAASVLIQQATAERKALADTIEARMKKVIKDAARVQYKQEGPPPGWRGVLAGAVLGMFLTGGVVAVACNFSFAWIEDARIGAEFKRVLPKLDPSLRDKLMEYLEKTRR
jgi:hypothetical protein